MITGNNTRLAIQATVELFSNHCQGHTPPSPHAAVQGHACSTPVGLSPMWDAPCSRRLCVPANVLPAPSTAVQAAALAPAAESQRGAAQRHPPRRSACGKDDHWKFQKSSLAFWTCVRVQMNGHVYVHKVVHAKVPGTVRLWLHYT